MSEIVAVCACAPIDRTNRIRNKANKLLGDKLLVQIMSRYHNRYCCWNKCVSSFCKWYYFFDRVTFRAMIQGNISITPNYGPILHKSQVLGITV